MITVIEAPTFLAAAAKIMDEEERGRLCSWLAAHPDDGDLVPDGHGIRKLRWAVQGRGKRGGARVIYYFHSENLPLLMLTIYLKNKKSDLTPAEEKMWGQIAKNFPKEYRRKK